MTWTAICRLQRRQGTCEDRAGQLGQARRLVERAKRAVLANCAEVRHLGLASTLQCRDVERTDKGMRRRPQQRPTLMVEDSDGVARERVSKLLADWANGDSAARERLVPIVYEELRRLAHHYMRAERDGHTLQTTAL